MRSKVTYSKFEVTSSNPSCFYLPKCLLAFLSIPYFFCLFLTMNLEHAAKVNHYSKRSKSTLFPGPGFDQGSAGLEASSLPPGHCKRAQKKAHA